MKLWFFDYVFFLYFYLYNSFRVCIFFFLLNFFCVFLVLKKMFKGWICWKMGLLMGIFLICFLGGCKWYFGCFLLVVLFIVFCEGSVWFLVDWLISCFCRNDIFMLSINFCCDGRKLLKVGLVVMVVEVIDMILGVLVIFLLFYY